MPSDLGLPMIFYGRPGSSWNSKLAIEVRSSNYLGKAH